LIWGSSFLFIKIAVRDLGPQALVFGRCLKATAALAAVLAVRGQSSLTAANLVRLPRYFAMALLNSIISWLGLAYGELTVHSGLSVVVGFLGTALLLLPDLRIGGATATLGSGFVLLAALSHAVAALY